MNEYVKYIVENQENEDMKQLAFTVYKDTVLDYLVSVQPIKNVTGKVEATTFKYEQKPYDGSGNFILNNGDEPKVGDSTGFLTITTETREVIAEKAPIRVMWPECCCECETTYDQITMAKAVKEVRSCEVRNAVTRLVIDDLLKHPSFSFEFKGTGGRSRLLLPEDQIYQCDLQKVIETLTLETGKRPTWMVMSSDSPAEGPFVGGIAEEVGLTVIFDSLFPKDIVLVGYRGNLETNEAEYFHAPYKFEVGDCCMVVHAAQGFFEPDAKHAIALIKIKK